MLDDLNVIKQRDLSNIIGSIVDQPDQLNQNFEVQNPNQKDNFINNIVVASMGGSALAVSIIKTWLKTELTIPVEIVRTYDLPAYVDDGSLVIAVSYSGGTEETISCLDQAREMNAHLAVVASGGKLIEIAKNGSIPHVVLPNVIQPRMAVINNICAVLSVLINFGLVKKDRMAEISSKADWLRSETNKWLPDVPTEQNYAKQLALHAEGKTAIFYGGSVSGPIANKWKLSFNENAKNLAFWNEIPEFCHNELSGWASHPIEKSFAVFDILSNFEHQQILKRFEISDQILSGQRPKSKEVHLDGDSIIEQLLWGCVLGDFIGVYLSILNNVDPTALPLVSSLKQKLV